MVAQAKAELPNECCGLLAGQIVTEDGSLPATPVGRVIHRYPLVNAAASPVEYLSDARSLFEAVRDMHRLGLDILAIYHSHPTSEPVPSRTDLERSYGEEVLNLIISLKSDGPRVRGWWLRANDFDEAEWQCVGDDSLDPESKPL